MTQAPERTRMTSPSSNETTSGSESTPVAARKVRRVPRITVEFSCLMCAREFGSLVCETLPSHGPVIIEQPGGFRVQVPTDQLRMLRCATCGGSVLPTDIIREEVRVERRIEWSEDRPKRGRPPKWLAEQRRREKEARDGF
jgi:hypothetical protein